jgi:hypothetical protein
MENPLEEYAFRRLIREVADGFRCLRLLGGASARNCIGQFEGLGTDDQMALARALISRRFERDDFSASERSLLDRYDRNFRTELLFSKDAHDGADEVPIKERFRLIDELVSTLDSTSPVKWVRTGNCLKGIATGECGSGRALMDLGSRRYAIEYSVTCALATASPVENVSLLNLIGVSSMTRAHCTTSGHFVAIARMYISEVDDLLSFVLNRTA